VFVTDWHEKGLSEFTYMYIMTVEFFYFMKHALDKTHLRNLIKD